MIVMRGGVAAAVAALAVLAHPAGAADIVAANQAAIDYASTGFLAERCGGSPWSEDRRNRALGTVLRAGWESALRTRRDVLNRQVQTAGLGIVCAALAAAYRERDE